MLQEGDKAPDFTFVRSCGIGILLAGMTLVGCGGGSSNSGTNGAKTTTTVTVAGVKQCLRAGGATRVEGAAEGNDGMVTARGPGGGRIFIGLYAGPAEAEKLSQEDAATFPTATFESVGRAVVGLVKFAEKDRELAKRCAGGH
jgi:hypothetical protein